MSDKGSPSTDHRCAAGVPSAPLVARPPTGRFGDALGRPLHDLRISVTDRCNFRCSYCMPEDVFDKHHAFLPQTSLLSFEEIARTARVFAGLGVRTIHLTGGEPLLRTNIERLIRMLGELRTPDGSPLGLAMTTNGSALAQKARALKDAGLQRITVSMDALDDGTFRRMNDVDFPVADVLTGIDAAERVGLRPIKVNTVVKRGTNDDQIISLARHFRGTSIVLRFIEYMDVGATNHWRMDEVLPSAEVLARIQAEFPLEAIAPSFAAETAARWRYRDGGGEIGVISSVTRPFCRDCSRARVSADGKLFFCLFAHHGHDLRALLRGGCSDEQIAGAVAPLWHARDDRYSELRSARAADSGHGHRRVEMHYIGG